MQKKYGFTRIVEESLEDIANTEADKAYAEIIARGFGISDKDITHIEDWTIPQINDEFGKIKFDVKRLATEGKKAFIFVYCVGHGVIDEFFTDNKVHS